jgi:hypothetical protein
MTPVIYFLIMVALCERDNVKLDAADKQALWDIWIPYHISLEVPGVDVSTMAFKRKTVDWFQGTMRIAGPATTSKYIEKLMSDDITSMGKLAITLGIMPDLKLPSSPKILGWLKSGFSVSDTLRMWARQADAA